MLYGACFAIIPASAFAMRRRQLEYFMTPAVAGHIVAFRVVAAASYWITVMPLAAVGRTYPAALLLSLALAGFWLWVDAKIALTVSLFVMQKSERRNIVEALCDSFWIVSSAVWWTVAGLSLCMIVCSSLLAYGIWLVLEAISPSPAASFLATLATSTIFTIGYACVSISLFGIAAAERREEIYAVH
jgi:hypothetical protein